MEGGLMLGILVFLLIVWLVVVVIGFAIEGLLWLAIIGLALFVVTAGIGWVRRRTLRR